MNHLFQDTNGGSLSNENSLVEKNNCFCPHNNASQGRKRPEIQDASFFNTRLKRKPDFDGSRY